MKLFTNLKNLYGNKKTDDKMYRLKKRIERIDLPVDEVMKNLNFILQQVSYDKGRIR